MLRAERIVAGYGDLRVLRDVDIEVNGGEFVCVLGPNGAGKTTLLRAITGSCRVWNGTVMLQDRNLAGKTDDQRARLGIGHVQEGRHVWTGLTVRENLLMGAWPIPRRERAAASSELLDWVIEIFPRLGERIGSRGGVLSGGEQQMLSIGRALMGRPRLLLIDEPSIGLAPIAVEAVMEALQRLRREKSLAGILVEQAAHDALELCDRVYLLNRGRVETSGPSSEFADRERVEAAYFAGGRRT